MKPIFNIEKKFFEKLSGIKLPKYCWRSNHSIYLNAFDKNPIIKFKVENKKIIIQKNKIKTIKKDSIVIEYIDKKKIISKEIRNLSWNEEIILNQERLEFLENESINKTLEFIWNNYNFDEIRIAHSSGKDSTVCYHILKKVLKLVKISDYKIDFNNTTNDTASTYRYIKALPKDKLEIHNPEKGWYMWIKKDKNYYIPTVMSRLCCSTYKEGQVKKYLNKDKKYLIFLGMRKSESPDRSKYDWDLNEAFLKNKGKLDVPSNWKRFLPILNWTDVDIWLYILKNKLKYNEMYNLGFNRCGCLICPYQDDYIDLITEEYYPFLWNRWMNILEINYKEYNVESRLKWSLEEWKLGKWKDSTSKEYSIIQLKPTPERIHELAELKGIEENIAEIYFKKTCKCCNKKLNPDEIAMNIRIKKDNLNPNEMLCKKCFSKEQGWSTKKYKETVMRFREMKCSLF